MSYQVAILRRAQKQLNKLGQQDRERVTRAIFELANEPWPQRSKKLQGRNGYSLRVGSYRALYDVDDIKKVVEVFIVAHRREAYR